MSRWQQMRRWKKLALLLLLCAALSQTPFIYRRYRLGRLHAAIERLDAQRAPLPADDSYTDYAGVVHVHSMLGGHSTGSFDDIARAAKANRLAFVVMTEHPSKYVNTAEATLKGQHDGVLFVAGSEINAGGDDRLLVLPGIAPPAGDAAATSTQNVVTQAKGEGRLVFVAYPEQLRSWELNGFDGIEIYNLYTNTKRINYVRLFFDGLWSYWGYPQLLFATFYERPDANLRKWDELLKRDASRRLVAIAGNDAHQNVGISLQTMDAKPLLQLRLDPYERSFQVVRTHVLLERAEKLDDASLLDALARGHCYIAFDLFGDSTGFRFDAENSTGHRTMGDDITLAEETRLRVRLPLKSRILFFRDGQVVHEERDTYGKELTVRERGVYRVEVYLTQLGEPLSKRPWIISNPIYVR